MGFNKKFFTTGGIVASSPPAAAGLDPLQNFETVTYTGNGSTQKITGYIRKGAAFNGSNSAISVSATSTTPVDFSQRNYSLSFWANTTTTTQSAMLSKYGDSDSARSFITEVRSSGIVRHYERGTSTFEDTSTTTTINDGNWHHIVVTKSSSQTIIYIDGTPDVTNSNTFTSNNGGTEDFRIGRDNPSSPAWFNGKIDQVRIFDKALDQDDVDDLYLETYADPKKSTTDYFGDGSGVALYQLDEDANDTGGSFGSLVSSPEIDLDVDGYTSGSVSDLSGNGNTATVTGATYGTDPNGGGYFDFDGSSDYLQISSNTDFQSTSNFTVEMWVKPDSLGFASLSNIYTTTSGNRKYNLAISDADGDLEFNTYSTSGGTALSGNNPNLRIQTGVWNHIVAVYEQNVNQEIFINGVSHASITPSTTIETGATQPLLIGALGSYIGTYDFDGQIGDVRFYDSALSPSQIVQNFNASKGSYGGGYHGTPTNVNFLGMAFQPDLVWFKNRTGTNSNALVDSVRGRDKYMFSDLTIAEPPSSTSGQDLVSFDSNGFTVGTVNNAGSANVSGGSIVAWCWKAAGYSNTFNVFEGGVTDTGSTASNVGITAGSNTNGWGVSANRDSGFSIVKYTGNGSNSSIGHGLNEAPELVIIKSRDQSTRNWIVHPTALGNNQYLFLNETNAAAGSSARIQSTTSTVVNIGTSSNVNASNDPLIMYCFHSVDGYQKVGSYTGLGFSAITVTTGFEPRFLLIKRYDSTGGNWYMYDQLRDGTNDRQLYANLGDDESTTGNVITYNSDGFTIAASGSGVNGSSSNYIYLAIA